MHINFNYSDITGSTKNLITRATTNTKIPYYSIDEFCERFAISEKTVRRRIQKASAIPNAHNLFTMVQGKYLVTAGLLTLGNTPQKELHNSEYALWLSAYSWKVAGTYMPYGEKSSKSVARSMQTLFAKMQAAFPGQDLQMFYAIERNSEGKGCHSHFVIGGGELDAKLAIDWLTGYFQPYGQSNLSSDAASSPTAQKVASVDLRVFDPQQNWLFYIVKQLHILPDSYEFLFTGM